MKRVGALLLALVLTLALFPVTALAAWSPTTAADVVAFSGPFSNLSVSTTTETDEDTAGAVVVTIGSGSYTAGGSFADSGSIFTDYKSLLYKGGSVLYPLGENNLYGRYGIIGFNLQALFDANAAFTGAETHWAFLQESEAFPKAYSITSLGDIVDPITNCLSGSPNFYDDSDYTKSRSSNQYQFSDLANWIAANEYVSLIVPDKSIAPTIKLVFKKDDGSNTYNGTDFLTVTIKNNASFSKLTMSGVDGDMPDSYYDFTNNASLNAIRNATDFATEFSFMGATKAGGPNQVIEIEQPFHGTAELLWDIPGVNSVMSTDDMLDYVSRLQDDWVTATWRVEITDVYSGEDIDIANEALQESFSNWTGTTVFVRGNPTSYTGGGYGVLGGGITLSPSSSVYNGYGTLQLGSNGFYNRFSGLAANGVTLTQGADYEVQNMGGNAIIVLNESFLQTLSGSVRFTAYFGSDSASCTVAFASVYVPDVALDPPKTGDATSLMGLVAVLIALAAVKAVRKYRLDH